MKKKKVEIDRRLDLLIALRWLLHQQPCDVLFSCRCCECESSGLVRLLLGGMSARDHV